MASGKILIFRPKSEKSVTGTNCSEDYTVSDYMKELSNVAQEAGLFEDHLKYQAQRIRFIIRDTSPNQEEVEYLFEYLSTWSSKDLLKVAESSNTNEMRTDPDYFHALVKALINSYS